VLRSDSPGMAPEEERKMLARLKRRLLDGVLTQDLNGVYGQALVAAMLHRLTPEERQQRADASDAGLQGLADRIGHTGGHWHKTNTVFFAKWKSTTGPGRSNEPPRPLHARGLHGDCPGDGPQVVLGTHARAHEEDGEAPGAD
jgi:hypothetical protein